jgi:hypothetical protein
MRVAEPIVLNRRVGVTGASSVWALYTRAGSVVAALCCWPLQ